MVVENKTVLEGNKVRQDLIDSTKRNFLPRCLVIVFLLVLTVLLVFTAFSEAKYMNLIVGAVFVFFDLYYIINGVKYYKSIPSKIDEQNRFLIDNTITYHFKLKEQSFLVFAIVNEYNRRLEYKYTDIAKIIEYHNRYEFKLNDNSFLYLYKNSYITEKGDEFFKKHLKLNKVKVKYKK